MPKPYRYRGRMIMAGLAGAVLVAVIAAAVLLPSAEGNANASQTTARQAATAARIAADRQWASATCTNILDWKNEIHRDTTSLDLGFGAPARIRDAVSATTRMLSRLSPPPSLQGGSATADAQKLRSDIESRVHALQADAAGVQSGNLSALGKLLTDVSRDKSAETEITNEFRHLLTADLGLSLAETHACRQLVGIPI